MTIKKSMRVTAGQRFGRLTVASEIAERGPSNQRLAICVCECGNLKKVGIAHLYSGNNKSCGCLRRDATIQSNQARKWIHGHSRPPTPTFKSWESMLGRCYRQKHEAYNRYGGRGIIVCQRWQGQKGFVNFLADMGERPKGMTLDRIDNDGDYEPGNCRWATYLEQARGTRKLSEDDIRQILSDTRFQRVVAADYGVSQGTIHNIKSGKNKLAKEVSDGIRMLDRN